MLLSVRLDGELEEAFQVFQKKHQLTTNSECARILLRFALSETERAPEPKPLPVKIEGLEDVADCLAIIQFGAGTFALQPGNPLPCWGVMMYYKDPRIAPVKAGPYLKQPYVSDEEPSWKAMERIERDERGSYSPP